VRFSNDASRFTDDGVSCDTEPMQTPVHLPRRLVCALSAAVIIAACAGGGGKPTTVELERIAFELPAGWQRETPTSTMRVAQAAIPGEAGSAQLTVFHFGEGKGGSADENIRRWILQVEFAPGSQSRREQFDVRGFLVTWVDFEGTLVPQPMSGGPAAAQPNSRLLGAVVEGPGGPWFFKATGANATLASQRDDFVAMLESVRAK
jgi:hypothetical protein